MKRTLSMILAALLFASSMTACGSGEAKETSAETKAPETSVTETAAAETEDASPEESYDNILITKNGIAKSHIILADGADSVLTLAAEELVFHIKKVTGADIAVTNTAVSDSLPIIIGTPDTHPELETLFPEDLAWLREVGEVGDTERWGDDGFSIRFQDGKLYIFGANSRGAMNGVYDFIEDTLGVLWIRSYEDEGLIYDEMPTVTAKVNYREKSPFDVRGWISGHFDFIDAATHSEKFFSRNKMNSVFSSVAFRDQRWKTDAAMGMSPFTAQHNLKWWVINSPSYDPTITEYWDTNEAGVHGDYNSSAQVNFWSELTVNTVADSVLAVLDQYASKVDLSYIGVNIEDWGAGTVYPEQNEPFEYALGQFVQPGEEDYLSTVFYTFLNKIARKVAEKYPETTIITFAYTFTQIPPRCELEDNIGLVFCPITEELCYSLYDETNENNATIYRDIENWKIKTRNITFYNYYGTFVTSVHYSRPIWERIQEHFQYYQQNGFNGVMSEGLVDYDCIHLWDTRSGHSPLTSTWHPTDEAFKCSDSWAMNTLTYWIYHKLAWNPNENVDELIVYFCDKVYGDASEYMQEYYRLIELGWTEGTKSLADAFNVPIKWTQEMLVYADYFMNNPDFEENEETANLTDRILEALNNAWEAADDVEKERIRHIKEMTEGVIEEYCW